MASSKIFEYANDISMNRSSASARSITTGGYGRTHRLGPSVLSFDVDLPILSESQYLDVENELLNIDDGINFLNVNLSSNNGNKIMSKNIIPTTDEIKFITTSYSTLRQITLCNLQPNVQNIFKVGDFIQFSNHPKVYQISKPLGLTGRFFNSTNAGTCTVRLSSPFVSNVGVSTSNSTGSLSYFYIVNGTGDSSEDVQYDWFSGNSGTYTNGLITFIDSNTNTTYKYSDGTDAVLNIPAYFYTSYDISSLGQNGINGTENNFNLSQSERDQNNKISQILNQIVDLTGQLEFKFNKPNIRAVLTTPSQGGQTMTNENVITTITNPYQSGLITFKNSDNTVAKDPNGDDLQIILPSTLNTAEDIYNYIKDTILASNSTHPLKVYNIIQTISGGYFPENWGETNLNHVGTFYIQFGPEYSNLKIELTTPTGVIATNYNPYELLNDTVATLDNSNIGITIENSTETYSVGEYLSPANQKIENYYVQKILSVNVSGTTTTILFDQTFNNSLSGWYDYSPSNQITRHLNTATTTTSTGFIEEIYPESNGTLYKNSYPIYMGPDVNIKLMLTKKPAVTIIPKNEQENLYKYDKFEFQEVL